MNRRINIDYIIISIVYTLAHGLMLFNKGVFWDDWILVNVDPSVNIERYQQTGFAFVGYFHNFMMSLNNPTLAYRLLIFICYLGAALFLFESLKLIKTVSPKTRLYIAIIFAIFPLNSARITLICSFYGLSYLLFFAATYCLLTYATKKNIYMRVIALLLFFMSFTTQSLLVFYSIPMLLFYNLMLEEKEGSLVNRIVKLSLKHMDFLVIPFIFWAIKKTFLMPSGIYSNYHHMSFDYLFKNLNIIIETFNLTIMEAIKKLFDFSVSVIILWIVLFMFLQISKQTLATSLPQLKPKELVKWSVFIILGYMAAILPYIVVKSFPSHTGWVSRHELLLPLSVSLAIVLIFSLLINLLRFNPRLELAIFTFFFALLINCNIVQYVDFQVDWYYQTAIIENFKKYDELKNATTILIEHEADEYRAYNRDRYSFYEYSGMMKAAFNDEKRFGLEKQLFSNSVSSFKVFFNRLYNLSEYEEAKPEYIIKISGKTPLNLNRELLQLMLYEQFDEKLFYEKVVNTIDFNVIPWNYKVKMNVSSKEISLDDTIEINVESFGGDKIEYEYFTQLPNKEWVVIKAYSDSKMIEWQGKEIGEYKIVVHSREVGTSTSYDAVDSVKILVK